MSFILGRHNNMFDYELIDSGDFRRLERFGDIILDRPALQANWGKKLKSEWKKIDAFFNIKDKNCKLWEKINKDIPESWIISIYDINVELNLGANGQIGIFPEQYTNWMWIDNKLKDIRKKQAAGDSRTVKILNGFCYTGIASTIALLNKNTEVYNVDALNSASTRFNRNLDLSGLSKSSTKFFIDDIITFLKREIKRENTYNAFILDPPAFGRLKNKTWSILKDTPLLIDLISKLANDSLEFIVLSMHDERIDKKQLEKYFDNFNIKNKKINLIDLTIKSLQGNNLPCGICIRIT